MDMVSGVSPGPRDAQVPVSTAERNAQMSTTTAVVIVLVAIVVIAGFYVLVGYIVHETGSTSGIADIGRARSHHLSPDRPRIVTRAHTPARPLPREHPH